MTNNTKRNSRRKDKMAQKEQAVAHTLEKDEKNITWKNLVIVGLPLLVLVVSGWISSQVQIGELKTRQDDQIQIQQQRDVEQKVTNDKIFEKLDQIIDTQHSIELQLKDKQDRK